MSGAVFSRVKNWTTEILSNTDLNAEIDNILNHLDPTGVGGYSDTAAEMKLQTSPGGLGTESLATSLAGEIERIRYVISQITGNTYWYIAPSNSLSGLVSALGTGLPQNRIVSGRSTGNSSQLIALVPNGSTCSVTLTASSTTPFQYCIGNTAYSITNSQLIALAAASSPQATAQIGISDSIFAAADLGQSKGYGMYGSIMGVQTASAGLATVVGQVCGFKLTATVSGTAEYAVGYVQSTSAIVDMWRGCFIDSSSARIPQQDIQHNAGPTVISLMKTSWIFANTGGSLAVTYANPTISANQPASPGTGDYWLDLGTTTWKTFNSTTWVAANATLIGMALQDSVACVAARTFEKFVSPSSLLNLSLDTASTSSIQAKNWFGQANVFGNANSFLDSRPTWNQTAVDTAVVISASSTYFLYMKENGTPIISDQFPLPRKDLLGFYHPQETWRALGNVQTNTSTAFQTPKTFIDQPSQSFMMLDPNFYGTAGYSTAEPMTAPSAYFSNRFPAYGQFSVGTVHMTATDAATISLTAGVYALSGMAHFSTQGGTPASTLVCFGVGQVAGTAFTGMVNGITSVRNYFLNGTNMTATDGTVTVTGAVTPLTISSPQDGQAICLPRVILNAGISEKTFYLKVFAGATASGTLNANGSFLVERLDGLTGTPV